MLLPSGLDADGAAVSKESAKWLAEVAAAKCIPEVDVGDGVFFVVAGGERPTNE
jgi:hypothetical protein